MRTTALRLRGLAATLALAAGCAATQRAPQPRAPAPERVRRAGPAVVELALGWDFTCARLADGTVRCWGANAAGQLGDGTFEARTRPARVTGLTGVEQVVAGSRHACARLADGTVHCWGNNGAGQLGDGAGADLAAPVAVVGLQGVAEITAAGGHTCARTVAGAVLCWGANLAGQIGDGGFVNRATPALVAGVSGAARITAGDDFVCARVRDGGVYCWGNEIHGRDEQGAASVPRRIAGLEGAEDLRARGHVVCVRSARPDARCYLLAANPADRVLTLPRGIAGGRAQRAEEAIAREGVARAVEGRRHSCAQADDGQVYCRGANDAGQLGDGTREERAGPVAVAW